MPPSSAPVARIAVFLGVDPGVVPAGCPVPDTYADHLGDEHRTDYDHLRACGALCDTGSGSQPDPPAPPPKGATGPREAPSGQDRPSRDWQLAALKDYAVRAGADKRAVSRARSKKDALQLIHDQEG